MYDFDDIMEQLRAGRSIEDIGNDFAAALNKAKAAHEAEEETKRKKEKAMRQVRVDRASNIIYDAIEFLDDFYPKVVTALFPNDEYSTDEMAEHLVQAMDEAYAEVFEGKKSSLTKQFEELADLFENVVVDLDKATNSTKDIKADNKCAKNEELKPLVHQYKGNKKADDSDDDGFAAVLRLFLNE